jgi:hypothetical protein
VWAVRGTVGTGLSPSRTSRGSGPLGVPDPTSEGPGARSREPPGESGIGDRYTRGLGYVYYTFQLRIEYTGNASLAYRGTEFKLRDAAGAEYPGSDVIHCSGTLARGEEAVCAVVMQVRSAAQGLILVYQPAAAGAAAVEVPLGF